MALPRTLPRDEWNKCRYIAEAVCLDDNGNLEIVNLIKEVAEEVLKEQKESCVSKFKKDKLNTNYCVVNSAGCYFDKYAFETIRRDCLEKIETRKFKYPRRCRKIFHNGKEQWREYMGAGRTCEPELKLKN